MDFFGGIFIEFVCDTSTINESHEIHTFYCASAITFDHLD